MICVFLREQLPFCNMILPFIYLLGISGHGGRGREHKRGHMGKCVQHAASGEFCIVGCSSLTSSSSTCDSATFSADSLNSLIKMLFTIEIKIDRMKIKRNFLVNICGC